MTASILLVDDEPNLLLSLEVLMRREGFQVWLAHDGEEAMQVLRRERPQLMVLDVTMPRKDGFEVCQEVRHDDALRDTLILILSARAQETDIAKGLALGANAYMTKPFSNLELVAKVHALLEAGA